VALAQVTAPELLTPHRLRLIHHSPATIFYHCLKRAGSMSHPLPAHSWGPETKPKPAHRAEGSREGAETPVSRAMASAAGGKREMGSCGGDASAEDRKRRVFIS